MTTSRVAPIIYIVLASFNISGISSLRNFNLILTDINCLAKEEYVANLSCTVDTGLPGPTRINIYFEMLQQVQEQRVGFFVNLNRSNAESIQLFKAANLDGCTIFSKNITSPIIIMLRDLLSNHGYNWTDCPIPGGLIYSLRNTTLDANYLPPFVPEAGFKVRINLYDKKIMYLQTTIYGKVSHVKRKKNPLNLKLLHSPVHTKIKNCDGGY